MNYVVDIHTLSILNPDCKMTPWSSVCANVCSLLYSWLTLCVCFLVDEKPADSAQRTSNMSLFKVRLLTPFIEMLCIVYLNHDWLFLFTGKYIWITSSPKQCFTIENFVITMKLLTMATLLFESLGSACLLWFATSLVSLLSVDRLVYARLAQAVGAVSHNKMRLQ